MPVKRPMHAAILSSVHLALDNRVFYREARTLSDAGYRVTLLAIHDGDEVVDGITIRGLPRVPRVQRPRLWRSILRAARELDADVFHVHDPELLLITPWLRRQTGRPTIYDIHEANAEFVAVKDYLPGPVRRPMAFLVRGLEPRLANHENGLIFADDQIAASFARYSGPNTTLFNFPGDQLIDAGTQPALPIGEREPVILYLGGLERNRGAALMISALAHVRQVVPKARLLIVGHFMPAQLEAEIQSRAAALGIADAVTVTGRVPFSEIPAYLRQARIGWIPWQPYPKNEKNVPTKLFEYWAFGLPVVSSNLASVRQFVRHDANGLLVTADDPGDHAAAIIALLCDPERSSKLGAAGQRAVVEHYNWRAMEGRLLQLYEEVLKQSS